MAIWPWYGLLAANDSYPGAGTFLSDGGVREPSAVAEAHWRPPGVKRGRMVNRTSGEPASQLHERHEASDFETRTQDKLGAGGSIGPLTLLQTRTSFASASCRVRLTPVSDARAPASLRQAGPTSQPVRQPGGTGACARRWAGLVPSPPRLRSVLCWPSLESRADEGSLVRTQRVSP
jgi:hypothetical protein